MRHHFTEADFQIYHEPVSLPRNWQGQAEAPSNIALIKYWGKKGEQIPMNASLSFTLSQSKTITKAEATLLKKKAPAVRFRFYFEGKRNEKFEDKIKTFFKRIEPYAPYLKQFEWTFHSENTFPHSSGIASSASGFAALAKIIMQLEQHLFPGLNRDYAAYKTSFLARLGSGSASRSTGSGIQVWGEHPEIPGSNDLYSVDFPFPVHENFRHMHDWIFLLDTGVKTVSSTKGHALIDRHPFKEARIQSVQQHLKSLSVAIQKGDYDTFGEIIEREALTLHALMMTSRPAYILMKPQTLEVIQTLWDFRRQTNARIYFTLDAGANLHLIFPSSEQENARKFTGSFEKITVIKDQIL